MVHIFQQRLIPCAPCCVSPNQTLRSQDEMEKCAHRYSRTAMCLPRPENDPGLPIRSHGLCLHTSILPGSVHLLAGSLALALVAGSLVCSVQSLRDALDFGGSRGKAALLMAGPSVSESQKGQAARPSPHKGEEAEFI